MDNYIHSMPNHISYLSLPLFLQRQIGVLINQLVMVEISLQVMIKYFILDTLQLILFIE